MPIRVNTEQLKDKFSLLDAVLKHSPMDKGVFFSIQGNVLKIYTTTRMLYMDSIPILESSSNSITTQGFSFEPVQDLLTVEYSTTVILTNEGVILENGYTRITLLGADYVTDRAPVLESTDPITLNSVYMDDTYKKLSMMSPLERIWQKELEILFCGNFLKVVTPAIVVQLPCGGLKGSIPLKDATVLKQFKPTSYASGELVYLYNGNGTIALPRNELDEEDIIKSYREQMSKVGEIHLSDLLPKITAISKQMQKCNCFLSIYDQNYALDVQKQAKSVCIQSGDVKGVPLLNLTISVELLTVVLKLLGSNAVEIYKGGDWVCLQTPGASILMSSLG